jgi:uncharacterized protein YbaA (DUF1428 family)
MSGYVDLFLLPLPKRNIAKYRRQAQAFGAVALKHGAVRYREFAGDDLFIKGMLSFAKKVRLKKGETIIAAVTEFTSRAHRDRVMKKMFNDARLEAMMESEPLFNMKRMAYGGFKTFVDF